MPATSASTATFVNARHNKLFKPRPLPSDTRDVDEREDLVTDEGFDWLYGEDADGSVVQDAPAIGAVVEPGGGSIPQGQSFDDPFETPTEGAFETAVPDAPQFFEPGSETESVAQALPPLPVHEEIDPAEDPFVAFDETIHPVGPQVFVEEPGPMNAASFMADFEADFSATYTTPDYMEASAPAAAVAAPPPPPPPPAPAPPQSEEETGVMEAVVAGGDTAMIPVLSSRGDIIPATPRKVSLRERVKPAPRVKTVATKKALSKSASKKGSGKAKKFASGALILTLALGSAVWRIDFLHDKVFGTGAPSEAQVAAAFTPLKGYSYGVMDPAMKKMMDKSADEIMPEEVENFEFRVLGTGPRPQGFVAIASVAPEHATPPLWDEEIMAEQGPGKPIKVGGVKGISVEGVGAQGASMVIFPDPDGLIFFVMGNTKADAENVASQLAKANS